MAKKAKKASKGRGATREDVELLLKVAGLCNTDYDFQATEWFWGEFQVKTFEEFKNRHPQ